MFKESANVPQAPEEGQPGVHHVHVSSRAGRQVRGGLDAPVAHVCINKFVHASCILVVLVCIEQSITLERIQSACKTEGSAGCCVPAVSLQLSNPWQASFLLEFPSVDFMGLSHGNCQLWQRRVHVSLGCLVVGWQAFAPPCTTAVTEVFSPSIGHRAGFAASTPGCGIVLERLT